MEDIVATLLDDTLLSETLRALPGWETDGRAIWRDVHLDPEQAAELRRQVAVDAEAMGHSPLVETRDDGALRFVLRTEDRGGVTELDIAFASHLSDLVHRISGDEPGVAAVREGDPVVIVRGPEADGVDEPPTVGVPTVSAGAAPVIPLPDDDPYAPEPGPNAEQRPRQPRRHEPDLVYPPES